MRNIKSLLVASILALSFASTGCDMEAADEEFVESEDDDGEWEDYDPKDPQIKFITNEQHEVYESCMDTLEENGARYRHAHRICKNKALSI